MGRALRKPARASKVGRRLLSEVKRDNDRVMDALRYVAHGETKHAAWLREQGYGLETVLKHAEEYAERWREGPSTSPPPPRHNGSATTGAAAQVAADLSFLQRYREVRRGK